MTGKENVLPLFQGQQLEAALGMTSGFNYIITNRNVYDSHNDWVADNAERIRTNIARWLSNENFNMVEDNPVDLSVLYEYTDEDHSCDLDNLLKPIISALDGSSGHEPYLVKDDKQIKRILLERREVDGHGLQMNYSIRPKKSETHGRVTISFRIHAPSKPMKFREDALHVI
jgi:Holliday junction resolvase RusA-like endonuclease